MYFCSSVGHPWVQVDGAAPDMPLDSAVLSRLKQFSAMNKLKKIVIRVSTFYPSALKFRDSTCQTRECWNVVSFKMPKEVLFHSEYAVS